MMAPLNPSVLHIAADLGCPARQWRKWIGHEKAKREPLKKKINTQKTSNAAAE